MPSASFPPSLGDAFASPKDGKQVNGLGFEK